MSDPIVKRGTTRTVIGTEVSELEVVLMSSGANTTVEGQSLGAFAQQGGFDGAVVQVERHFAPDWSSDTGALTMFVGTVGDVTVTGTEVTLALKSPLELLGIQMPRNIYSGQCIRTLYDQGCTLVASALTDTITAAANSTRFSLLSTGDFQINGYYELGTIEALDGLNVGKKRTVKKYLNTGSGHGQFKLAFPFPYAPQAGDTFSAKPGCDKLLDTCDNKFGNRDNFRGWPFIPPPESTL
jgi:uncharacterized phage protein (TIGR02218 family)